MRLSLAPYPEFKGALSCGVPMRHLERDTVEVTLHKQDGENTVRFHGIATCSSPWICPVCSPSLGSRRGEALGRALAHFAAAGCHVVHAVLTVRHTRGQPLEDVFGALADAWRKMTKDRAFRPHWSGLGYARGVEVTFGRNGWHPHIHLALVVPPGRDPYALEEALWAAWSGAVVGVGWEASDRGAYHYHICRTEADVMEAGQYAAKGAAGWGAGPETAGGMTKISRGGLTPFQLLGAAWDEYLADPEKMHSWFGGGTIIGEAGLQAALAKGGGLIIREFCRTSSSTTKKLNITPEEAAWRWLEYCEATKGRKNLTTSRALGLVLKLKLEEIEAEDQKAVPSEILWLAHGTYVRLLLTAQLAYFVHLAETLGSLRWACQVMGLIEGQDYTLPPTNAPPDWGVGTAA